MLERIIRFKAAPRAMRLDHQDTQQALNSYATITQITRFQIDDGSTESAGNVTAGTLALI